MHELYNTNQAGTRDQPTGTVKFAPPTIANGKVYLGTQNGIAIYGRFDAASSPPTAPSNLKATAAGSPQINLNWTDNSSNETGFTIERSVDNMNFVTAAVAAPNAIDYVDNSLSPSTHYYYRVRATNSAGNSAPSNVADASTTQASTSQFAAAWTLDEGTGVIAGDASGHGHDGTLSGEITWIAGKVGPSALSFHTVGATSHVTVPDAADLRFTAAQSFSLTAWVNVFALPGQWSGIVTKSRDAGPWYGLWIDPSNRWVAGGWTNLIGSAATTGWHHLALVQDGAAGTRRLYVDGVLAASGAAQAGDGHGELWMGGAKSVNEYFNGALDEVRIYNRALPAGEVLTMAQGSLAAWTLDEGTGVIAGDASGHGHDGTLSGEITWIAGKVGPSALSFHTVGATSHVTVPDAADLRFTAAQSFSLTAWVNVFALPGQWSGIVTKSRDAGPWYGLWIDPSNRWVAGGWTNLIGSAATTGWHHLALVQDGAAGTRRLYVDGVLAASGAAQAGDGHGELWMGGAKSVNEYFNGALDEVRIYNRALPAGEVLTMAQGSLAAWTLDEGTGVIAGGASGRFNDPNGPS